MIISLTQCYGRCVTTATQELLVSKGIRATRRRAEVLDALRDEPNDATAQEIHDRLRRRGAAIGLATVYRTLALLSAEGVVDALMHRPGEVCYRLCGQGHHHHLTCSECHQVVELDCELEPWLERLGSDHGFEVTGHAVEVTGICGGCSRS
jgi:Fur family ferric uptake transcriptional regulator